MNGESRQEAAVPGGRLRGEPGSDAARLFDEVHRLFRRTSETLDSAERAEARGDVAAAGTARRQAIALLDDLHHLSARLRKAQSSVAESLALSGRLGAALSAYRQPSKSGSRKP